MTSAEHQCKKNTIVQEYTQQTKTATAAVEQDMKSQIAGMNFNNSVVLASIHHSQVVCAYEMVMLQEQLDSQCAAASNAPTATAGEKACGGGVGGDAGGDAGGGVGGECNGKST